MYVTPYIINKPGKLKIEHYNVTCLMLGNREINNIREPYIIDGIYVIIMLKYQRSSHIEKINYNFSQESSYEMCDQEIIK